MLEEEKTTAEKLNGFSAPVLATGKLKELPHRSLSSQSKTEALSLAEVAGKEAFKQINTQNSYEFIDLAEWIQRKSNMQLLAAVGSL